MSAAPASAPPRYRVENFPPELVALPRWVVFQIVRGVNGKTKKLPLIPGITGRHPAKADDPKTWRSFAEAHRDAEVRGLYLAFVFDRSLRYFFLDGDDVLLADGTIRPDVQTLRDTLDTYSEWSVRGNGIHIIGKGAFPEQSAPYSVPAGCKTIERYPLRGARFCIFTGDVIPGFAVIEERGDVLAALFPPRATAHTNGNTNGAGYRGPSDELTPAEADATIASATPMWTDGRRHHMAVFLSGYLGKQGVPRAQAVSIIERCATDDSDPGAKVAACEDTYDDLEAGADVSGWYGLRDACGLSDDELAPLAATLGAYWNRCHPRAVAAAVEAPAFPADALPPDFQAYAVDAAASLQAPVEMVAAPMIGFAGAVIGNRAHLALKNSWREYPALFLAVVAPPGSAKTPGLNLAQWPLDALQSDAEQAYRLRKEQYETALVEWQQSKDYDKPKPPKLRDYFSSNLTLEALFGMFDRAPGVTIIRDEILGWVLSMDQYRAGKGSDRQEYLSLWSCKTIKLDRKGADPIYRRFPVACVVGGIQPDLVGGLHNEGQKRDGFVERLLPIVPETHPMPWTEDTVSRERYAAVLDLYRSLDALPLAELDVDNGDAIGIRVELSSAARALFVDWFNENQLLIGRADGLAAGFYSKLPAHVARFALILHALWNPTDYEIRKMVSAERMEDAIELGEFFRAHIGRFLALLKSAAPDCSAGVHARVMRQMRNANGVKESEWVSRSDIYRGLRNVPAAELSDVLDDLVNAEKIERRVDRDPERSKKPTAYYRVRISQLSHLSTIPGPQEGTNATNTTSANGIANGDVPPNCANLKTCRVLGPCQYRDESGRCVIGVAP